MGKLLSPAQVAERLGVARLTVYRLISRGDLPSVHLSARAVRVTESDLEAFVADRRRA